MTVLCPSKDIDEDSARGFELEGKSVFVVKKDGQVYVYLNSCPHISIPLEFQPDDFLDMEKQYIQCANHGALFEIETGDCVTGPCIGQALKAIAFHLEDGNIVLD